MSYRGRGGGRRDDRPYNSYGGGGRSSGGGYRGGGRGGGGGYYGGGGGGGRHQAAGFKRGREEEAPRQDPRRELIALLLSLGEPKDARDSPESTIMPAVHALRRAVERGMPDLDELLIEAVVGAPLKTPHLALVAGLLRLSEPAWVDGAVRRAADEANAALAAGGAGRDRARLLVRWLACLAAPGVVSAASAARVLQALLDAAAAAAARFAPADPSGGAWQPWADHLAYCALAALPWAGAELAEAAPDALAGVLAAADAYLSARPRRFDSELAPFAAGALPEDDPGAAADSGGASFLGQLHEAVTACGREQQWRVESIPHGLLAAFAERLVTGGGRGDGDGDGAPPPPVELPLLAVPDAPPSNPVPDSGAPVTALAAAAARLRAAYPPRGGLVLLPRDKLEAGRPAVERLVLEEYVLDAAAAHAGRRVELATVLARRLPVPYDGLGIVVETLLGALARLPAPEQRPVAYAALLMDVCKLAREAPRYVAAWLRAVYDRAAALDPELRRRLADYLAHHLSNFQWLWGWERWADALDEPPGAPKRAFCAAVLARMVALSYYEHLKDGWAQAMDPEAREMRRIKRFLPDEWAPLLGAKPAIPPLPGTGPPPPAAAAAEQQQQQPENNNDAEMQEAGGSEQKQQQQQQQEKDGSNGANDNDNTSKQQQVMQEEEVEPVTPELEWAARLVGVLRSRKPAPMPGAQGEPRSADDVAAWMDEEGMRAALGGDAAAVVRAAARAVLAAGSKTPTHFDVMLSRYGGLLRRLADEAAAAAAAAGGGDDDARVGTDALLDAVAAAYGRHPTRLALAFDRLQAAGVVPAADVVDWALRWDWLQLAGPSGGAGCEARADAAETVLRGALAGALASEDAAHEEAVRQGAAVRDAETQLTAAAAEVARARERDAAAAGGGGGGDDAPRLQARTEFALRAEAAVAARLAEARRELERVQARVDAAAPALSAAILALLRGIKRLLGGGGGDANMADASDGDGDAARREALARARALVRPLALPAQAVAREVRDLFAPAQAPEDLRAAVLGPLGLL